jgi:hypothetical protein
MLKMFCPHFHGQARTSIRSLKSVEQSQEQHNAWQAGEPVQGKKLRLKAVD